MYGCENRFKIGGYYVGHPFIEQVVEQGAATGNKRVCPFFGVKNSAAHEETRLMADTSIQTFLLIRDATACMPQLS
jgi:hypothetical protein